MYFDRRSLLRVYLRTSSALSSNKLAGGGTGFGVSACFSGDGSVQQLKAELKKLTPDGAAYQGGVKGDDDDDTDIDAPLYYMI